LLSAYPYAPQPSLAAFMSMNSADVTGLAASMSYPITDGGSENWPPISTGMY